MNNPLPLDGLSDDAIALFMELRRSGTKIAAETSDTNLPYANVAGWIRIPPDGTLYFLDGACLTNEQWSRAYRHAGELFRVLRTWPPPKEPKIVWDD